MQSFPGKSAWLSEFPCLASSSFFSLPPFALFRPVLHRRPFIRFNPIHSFHSFILSLYPSILSPLHSFPSSSCSFFLTSVLRIVTSADPRLRSFCRLSPFLTDGPLSSASSSSQHPASRRRLRGHSHINLLLDGSLKRPASFSLSLYSEFAVSQVEELDSVKSTTFRRKCWGGKRVLYFRITTVVAHFTSS